MKEKTRKILIMAVMAALIISLMAASLCYAFTYGRYTGGRRDENSPYEDYIDFVGATAFTVTSPEEFVNAIENGYSYIKIADGAEDPFVINEDIADVYTNLVLDVNGTTVIRNSRNPVLDVRRSISVVLVYDSSEGASGGFYNPVGSALQTSGGSLTIGSGSYESGPNVEGTETLSSTTATVYKRNGSRPDAEDYAFDATVTEMPSLGGDVYYTGDTTQYTYIENDTYLIYTEEENAFVSDGQLYVNAKSTSTTGTDGSQTTTVTGTQLTPICNVASCDFYYYYQIDAGETDNDYDQTYAVVYGYNDVKGLAEDSTDDTTAVDLREKGLAWPYAAIRSVEDGTVGGVTHARGGAFTTNFGTDNTYGILSVGGEMTVGTESATAPPTFTAVGEGTCIGMSAQTGDTLTIASGTFSSEVGDTILMRGGEMTVTRGSFTKNASSADPNSTDNGSAISISGGKLNVKGASTVQFNIKGSYVNGIRTEKETTGEVEDDKITNAAFNFNTGEGESGSSNIGISANGGTTIATNCIFTMPGSNNTGIYAQGGTTTATGSEFTLTGNHSYGVHAKNGETTVSGCTIDMTGEYVSGIYTTGGTVTVDGGTVEVSFAEWKTDKLLTSTAVSTEGGNIAMAGNVRIASESLGITARSGTITIDETADVRLGRSLTESEGSVEVSENLRATGIYINNGSLTNKGTVTVTSCVGEEDGTDNGWSWVDENGNAIDFNKYNGVYVQGGSLTSNGTLNVDFTGVVSDAISPNGGDNMGLTEQNAYREFKVKSYAVRVEAGTTTSSSVIIAAGEITNDVGGGVLVNGGTVYLGAEDGTGPVVSATAREGMVDDEDVYYSEIGVVAATGDDADPNWRYAPPRFGGDAVKVVDGELTIQGGSYSARHGNGILVSDGGAEVYSGTFSGNDVRNDNRTSDYLTGAGSAFGFKLLGGNLTVNGGTFSSGGGGAFVMEGTLNFIAGTVLAQGPTGISAWEGAIVYFGGTSEGASADADVEVHANSTGIAVETRTVIAPNITVYNGTYTGGINYSEHGITRPSTGSFDGIWYGNVAATLRIEGGTFQGYNRAGLFIDGNPGSNIQISGGTFEATNRGGAISGNSPGRITTGNIIASGSWCFDSEAVLAGNVTDETKRQHAICTYEFAWGTLDQYDYFQVGGGNSVNLTNNVSINGGDSRAFNTLGTIVVAIGDQITYRQ